MYKTSDYSDKKLIAALNAGGIAVVRTDTVYGIIAQADNEQAVERVFDVKQRDTDKPLIVLVASMQDIPGLTTAARTTYENLSAVQPTSIIVPETNQPTWITRRQGSVAYRVPSFKPLHDLILQTGPLVAPSANPQSLPTARTIQEAIDYFGESINAYVNGGEVPKEISPSKLIRLDGDKVVVLR